MTTCEDFLNMLRQQGDAVQSVYGRRVRELEHQGLLDHFKITRLESERDEARKLIQDLNGSLATEQAATRELSADIEELQRQLEAARRPTPPEREPHLQPDQSKATTHNPNPGDESPRDSTQCGLGPGTKSAGSSVMTGTAIQTHATWSRHASDESSPMLPVAATPALIVQESGTGSSTLGLIATPTSTAHRQTANGTGPSMPGRAAATSDTPAGQDTIVTASSTISPFTTPPSSAPRNLESSLSNLLFAIALLDQDPKIARDLSSDPNGLFAVKDASEMPQKLLVVFQRNVVNSFNGVDQKSIDKVASMENTTSCVHMTMRTQGSSRWVKQHPQSFACKTCVNMQRLCVVKLDQKFYALPIHPALNEAMGVNVTFEDEEFWVSNIPRMTSKTMAKLLTIWG